MPTSTGVGNPHDGQLLLASGAPDHVALVAEGRPPVRYRQLLHGCARARSTLGERKQLVLIAADGSLESIECVVSVFAAGHAAILIADGKPDQIDAVRLLYQPQWQYRRGAAAWEIDRLHTEPLDIHPELGLMLSTSGSTGTGKFVRLSYANLLGNAQAIRTYLELDARDRGLLSLPVHYSYGLSVLTSHLASGAAVLVSSRSFTDPALWSFFVAEGGTNVSGVPHNYRLLDTLAEPPVLPRLRFMTQAGGALGPDAVVRHAQRAERQGARFYVMYGQTEASPRMAYVPPHLVRAHPGCIGVPVPGGQLRLVDDDGHDIDGPDVEGELVYRGPNVMMGYATGVADLAAAPGPQELHTGDLARRNAQGLYRITGRKSRFLKLFGLRISLDEIERRLDAEGVASICTGNDEELAVVTCHASGTAALQARVAALASLPPGAVRIVPVADLPRLPSGKPDLVGARQLAVAAAARERAEAAVRPSHHASGALHAPRGAARGRSHSVLDAYARLFPAAAIDEDSSFHSLGGDSLSYIEASMALEELIGALPDDWPDLPVRTLEAMRAPRRWLQPMDTSIFLRATAMVTVVSNHFGWFHWRGGAYFLMVLAGYNFARFALRNTLRTASVKPVLLLAAGIAVPTLLTLWLRQAKAGELEALPLLLLGNFQPPSDRRTLYWFLEALSQLLLVMALLLYPARVRHAVERSPFVAALCLLAVGSLLSMAMPGVWDTSHLHQWVPHMLLWMFALGWLIQASRTTRERGVAAALLAVLPLTAGMHVHQPDDGLGDWMVWMWVGGTALLWVPCVPLPRPLSTTAHYIAGASLFIFLFHNDARRWLRDTGLDLHVGVVVAAGIGLGIVAWLLWERMLKSARQRLHAARQRMPRKPRSPMPGSGRGAPGA